MISKILGVARYHLQHVSFLQVNCLETEAFNVVPFVDVIWVPTWPQGVDAGDGVLASHSCCDNPIFTSLQHGYHSCQSIRVHMEGADGPFPSHEGPFQLGPQRRNIKSRSILGGKSRLGDLVRRQATELTGNVEVSNVSG